MCDFRAKQCRSMGLWDLQRSWESLWHLSIDCLIWNLPLHSHSDFREDYCEINSETFSKVNVNRLSKITVILDYSCMAVHWKSLGFRLKRKLLLRNHWMRRFDRSALLTIWMNSLVGLLFFCFFHSSIQICWRRLVAITSFNQCFAKHEPFYSFQVVTALQQCLHYNEFCDRFKSETADLVSAELHNTGK